MGPIEKSITYSIAGKFRSMPSPETPRLLFVHAHPDDETLTTGGTIAHYAASGADVHVVTCTLGEEGEVIGDIYAQLAVDYADQLGGYRISELTAALQRPWCQEAEFPWRPGPLARLRHGGHSSRAAIGGSWMPTWARRSARSSPSSGSYGLTSSSPTTPTADTAIPTTSRPTASPPRRSPRRQTDDYPGDTVERARSSIGPSSPRARWAAGLDNLDGVPDDWMRVTIDVVPFGYPDDKIDAVIDARDHLSAKVAALRAHATQVTVAPNGGSFALSNNVALPHPRR